MGTPEIESTHEKLLALSKEVKEMEDKRRYEAHMYSRMKKWNPRSVSTKDIELNTDKHHVRMRRHRKKIKMKISLKYNEKKGFDDSDANSSSPDEYDMF